MENNYLKQIFELIAEARETLPTSVMLDVFQRCSDWLSTEGTTMNDNYIRNQLNYLRGLKNLEPVTTTPEKTFIVIIDDKTFTCKDKEAILETIKKNYMESDVCFDEFLRCVTIHNLSIEEQFQLFASLKKQYNGDITLVVYDQHGSIELWSEIEKEGSVGSLEIV